MPAWPAEQATRVKPPTISRHRPPPAFARSHALDGRCSRARGTRPAESLCTNPMRGTGPPRRGHATLGTPRRNHSHPKSEGAADGVLRRQGGLRMDWRSSSRGALEIILTQNRGVPADGGVATAGAFARSTCTLTLSGESHDRGALSRPMTIPLRFPPRTVAVPFAARSDLWERFRALSAQTGEIT